MSDGKIEVAFGIGTMIDNGKPATAVVVRDQVASLASIVARHSTPGAVAPVMRDLLPDWERWHGWLRGLDLKPAPDEGWKPINSVKFMAPVPEPSSNAWCSVTCSTIAYCCLDPRPDEDEGQDDRQGVAPHQGARRLGAARAPEAAYPQESIFSGLTLEELASGAEPRGGDPGRARAPGGAAPDGPRVADVKLMLAEPRDAPFTRPGWLWELKYDGYRLLAGREGGRGAACATATAWTRRRRFRRSRAPCAALPYDALRPRRRGRRARREGAAELRPPPEARAPAAAHRHRARRGRAAGDALRVRPARLRGLRPARPAALGRARRCCSASCRAPGPCASRTTSRSSGDDLLAAAGELGPRGRRRQEGRLDLPRRPLRRLAQGAPRPHRATSSSSATRSPRAARSGFGALHLACYRQDGGLVYARPRRHGLHRTSSSREIHARLESASRATPACAGPLPDGPRPRLGRAGARLRGPLQGVDRRGPAAPSRLPAPARGQADRGVRPRRRRRDSRDGAAEPAPPSRRGPPRSRRRSVPFSNLDKVFWPEEGYTKGDLIEYYRAISPWLLPYLKDRPARHDPLPRRHRRASRSSRRTRPLRAGLGAPRADLERARRARDRLLRLRRPRDAPLRRQPRLDPAPRLVEPRRLARAAGLVHPGPRPQGRAVRARRQDRAARSTRSARRSSCPSFIKTSGATGCTSCCPLGGQCTYAESRTLGEILARVVEKELPEIATTARMLGARGGKVYVDYLQNGHGKTIAGPFSARPGARRDLLGAALVERGRREARPEEVHAQDAARADEEAEGRIRSRRC